MSTTFPTTLQDLDATRGSSGNALSSPNHITHHTNEDDTIEAIQAKLGIDNSAVVTSIDYLLKSSSSSNPGHKHTLSSLSDFNVTSVANLDFLQYNSSSAKWVNIPKASMAFKFGGDGTDGALAISSGTTTIDCANAAVVIKNYTSFAIIGTGKLAFSNPNANGTIVIIRSQGAVTLTSSQAPMIDMSAMGASGGASVAMASPSSNVNGNPGNNGLTFTQWLTNGGQGGGNSGGTQGVGGAIPSSVYTSIISLLLSKYPNGFVGAGGGSGSTGGGSGSQGSGSSGVGGKGGGGLIIECAGAWNFTTTGGISVKGENGGTGSASGGTNTVADGGGGGGGGFFFGVYNTLTANSGTVTVSGGTGGVKGGTGTGIGGGGGGGGQAAGNTKNGDSGGDGGVGLSSVKQNTEFV